MKEKPTVFNFKALMRSCMIAVSLLLAGTAVLALLMSRNIASESALGYGLALILLISSLSGSGVMVKVGEKNGALAGASVAVAIWLLLLATNVLLFDGTYHGVFETLLLLAGGSLAAVLLGAKNKKRSKFSARYKRNR